MTAVHNSPFAGSWYPESAAELSRLLANVFEESRKRTGPHLDAGALGYVVPHAAPVYSGTVAAAVYRAIEQQKPEQIVLLAFPHRGGLTGFATPDVDAIWTPLGPVPFEPEDLRRVAEREVCDHSLELQLPFLQSVAPQARITPVYVGGMSAAGRSEAALKLAAIWRPGVVYVASSDFTHYGRDFHFTPFPPDGERLRALDFECIEAAGSLDATLFLETLSKTGATVCGAAPIALLLEILRHLGAGDVYQSTLDYQTSAEISGDRDHSVSYAALAYHRRAAYLLSGEDGEALLDAAAETLQRVREPNGDGRAVAVARGSVALQARRGAFVSLHRGEELLGCIGNSTGHSSLAEQIPELTISAALDDPRFAPAAERSGPIDIEISVLTPFRRVRGPHDLVLGRHGALLRVKGRSGLLLPQVAEDHRWTTGEEFLAALTRKVLLPRDSWRLPEARLLVFEAQLFSRPGLRAKS